MGGQRGVGARVLRGAATELAGALADGTLLAVSRTSVWPSRSDASSSARSASASWTSPST